MTGMLGYVESNPVVRSTTVTRETVRSGEGMDWGGMGAGIIRGEFVIEVYCRFSSVSPVRGWATEETGGSRQSRG